jgi:F-type H+-transporting ATPase subunit alpha
VLFAMQINYFDDVAVEDLKKFHTGLVEHLTTRKSDLLNKIAQQKALSDEIVAELKSAIEEFKSSRA